MELFQLEIIMNPAVVGVRTPHSSLNRGMSIDNGTSSSVTGMHQVGIEG